MVEKQKSTPNWLIVLRVISYRILSVLITVVAAYCYYGDLGQSMLFSLIQNVVMLIAHYFHDKIWSVFVEEESK